MDGFQTPDFSQPVDVDAHLQRCHPEATTRGMFLADIVEALKQRNLPLPATPRATSTRGSPRRRRCVASGSSPTPPSPTP
jgi:hypothetical protein